MSGQTPTSTPTPAPTHGHTSTRDDVTQSSMNLATIALLTNVNCRARLETLDTIHDIRRKQRQQMRSDIRFYRKRILKAFKDLLFRKEQASSAGERVHCAFDELVRVLIAEMKMADTTDIIQSGIGESGGEDDDGCDGGEGLGTAQNVDDGGKCDNTEENDDQTVKLIDDANGFLTASKSTPITIDRFVIKRPIDEPFVGRSTKSKQNQMRSVPPASQVNLKEPSLRSKGLQLPTIVVKTDDTTTCNRKENVARKYDNEAILTKAEHSAGQEGTPDKTENTRKTSDEKRRRKGKSKDRVKDKDSV